MKVSSDPHSEMTARSWCRVTQIPSLSLRLARKRVGLREKEEGVLLHEIVHRIKPFDGKVTVHRQKWFIFAQHLSAPREGAKEIRTEKWSVVPFSS